MLEIFIARLRQWLKRVIKIFKRKSKEVNDKLSSEELNRVLFERARMIYDKEKSYRQSYKYYITDLPHEHRDFTAFKNDLNRIFILLHLHEIKYMEDQIEYVKPFCTNVRLIPISQEKAGKYPRKMVFNFANKYYLIKDIHDLYEKKKKVKKKGVKHGK